jgi:hypothetical protein
MWGWLSTPIWFGLEDPIRPAWGWGTTPMAHRGGSATPIWPHWVAGPPKWSMGVVRQPQAGEIGHPLGQMGVADHPQMVHGVASATPQFIYLFF